MKFHGSRGMVTISVDDIVQTESVRQKITFCEAYPEVCPKIYEQLDTQIKRAVINRQHVIFDLDDLITVEQRAYYLQLLRDLKAPHQKLAMVFEPPINHHERHLARKDFPFSWEDVLDDIMKFEMPTIEEGFDEIVSRRM